jgi:hypothetical protein
MPDSATRRALARAAIARALAFAALFACAPAAAQTMYKWVDEKGVTHFSETPPPGDRKAAKVTPKVTPSGNPSAYDPQGWKAREAESKKLRVDRGLQDQSNAKDRERRAAACDRARSRIAFLQNTHRIHRDNPDGTRTFLDDAQREVEIERSREAAAEYCR